TKLARDVGGGGVGLSFDVFRALDLERNFGMLRHVEPFVAVQMLLLHRIAKVERVGLDDDLAFHGAGILGVERYFAGNARGDTVDRFQRSVGFENDVVHAFRVFEIKLAGRGRRSRNEGCGDECAKQFGFHDDELTYLFLVFATNNETMNSASVPARQTASRSIPGTSFVSTIGPSISVTGSFCHRVT